MDAEGSQWLLRNLPAVTWGAQGREVLVVHSVQAPLELSAESKLIDGY